MEKSTLEEIKLKNPFMYIIKLSESKKRNKSKSNIKNKKSFITPIKARNESKSKNRKISSNTNKPKKEDYINEINSLKNKLAQKEAALTKAKTEINDLLKENITLKAKVSQYKEKIDNMASDAHILSKETLIYNYFLGINDEIMNGLNNNTSIPNLDEMTYEELLALEDKIGYVNKGYSNEQICKIPIIKYHRTKKENEKCVICQFDIEEGSNIKKLNCEHFYHDKCIDEWLSKEKHCPFCKIEVKIPEN